MFAMVMYVPARHMGGGMKKKVVETAHATLCEGFGVERSEVKVLLECVEDTECNARVLDVYFPILYIPKNTPYEAKKRTGKLLYDRLLALYPNGEMKNVYLHIKEHDLSNYALNGKSAAFDKELKKRIETMQENLTGGQGK